MAEPQGAPLEKSPNGEPVSPNLQKPSDVPAAETLTSNDTQSMQGTPSSQVADPPGASPHSADTASTISEIANPAESSPNGRAAERARNAAPGNEWIGGAVLIVLGLLFLLSRFIPDIGDLVTLIVGLGLLGVFFATRSYGALIPGGIVTGVGVGILLNNNLPGANGGGIFLLSLAGGFLLIWILSVALRVGENYWWPIIPAAFIGVTGIALVVGPVGRDVLAYGWPVVLIALGLYVVFRGIIARR